MLSVKIIFKYLGEKFTSRFNRRHHKGLANWVNDEKNISTCKQKTQQGEM